MLPTHWLSFVIQLVIICYKFVKICCPASCIAGYILLAIVKMIEYINLLLLLTMFGSNCYVYHRIKKIFYVISIVMDSEILDQLTNLGRDVDSEFPKPKRGRKKKADTKMNELEDNDARDKRERLVACVLSGNSEMYLGKEYTEQQINEMDYNSINTLLNRYESVLSAQMTKSLGKSVINLYSNIACSVLGVGNQQELSTNLECDPFLNTALQRFTCDLYYRFGALLAPVSVGIITGKYRAPNRTKILPINIDILLLLQIMYILVLNKYRHTSFFL